MGLSQTEGAQQRKPVHAEGQSARLAEAHDAEQQREPVYSEAESRMRTALIDIAHAEFGHQKKQPFRDGGLSTDELIDVLAPTRTRVSDRLGFIKDMLQAAYRDYDAAILFAKKAYNILGHTSIDEQKKILDFLQRQTEQSKLTKSLEIILLRNSRSLEGALELVRSVDPKTVKSALRHKHQMREIIAKTELLSEFRKYRFAGRCGHNASKELVNERFQRLGELCNELEEYLKKSPFKETEEVKTALRNVRRARKAIEKDGSRNRKPSNRIEAYNLIAARFSFELRYNISLTDRAGKMAASWDLAEVQAASDLFKKIENHFGHWLIRATELYEIQRCSTLNSKGAYEPFADVDELGKMRIANRARWTDADAKTGESFEMFKHSIAHEFAHLLQYPYNDVWVWRRPPGEKLMRLAPTTSRDYLHYLISAWDEHALESDWCKVPKGMYSIRKLSGGGICVRINGNDYEKGAIARVGDREVQFFYHEEEKELWAYNPRTVFPRHKQGRWGAEEEYPETFAQIVRRTVDKSRARSEKVKHFKRKFAGHKRRSSGVPREKRKRLPARSAAEVRRSIRKRERGTGHSPGALRNSFPKQAELASLGSSRASNGPIVSLTPSDQLALKLLRILSVEEQSAVIAKGMLGTDLGELSPEYPAMYAENRESSLLQRNRLALGLLADPRRSEYFWEGLREFHRDTLPSVLLSHYAALRGDEIGIADPRPNRSGHAALLQLVNYGLGEEIPGKNIYMVLDNERNGRLKAAMQRYGRITSGTLEAMKRKPAPWYLAFIALDFLRGAYIDNDGAKRKLSVKYDRVVVYNPDQEARELMRKLSREAGLSDRLKVGDPDRYDYDQLWRRLRDTVEKKDLAERDLDAGRERKRKTIRFFSLEDGLVTTGASTRVVMKDTGEELERVPSPPGAFSVDGVLDETAERFRVSRSALAIDDGDFTDIARINSFLVGEQLFKRRKG